MKVTFRDAGLWILPESKEEHTALGVLYRGLGGVPGAYLDSNWTVVVPTPRPMEERYSYYDAARESSGA
jgi:hypothetical protein